jgi:hypothetical protein
VIICNRCGKQVPAGLARCQNCGMPLSSAANNSMNAQGQGELPAWLESLRANERPGVPAGGQPGFSTADLIDDDDLPGWMRAEQAQVGGESDSNKHPAIRPASMSAPNTDAGMMRAESFSARDLIDPVSLPSWMNPSQQPANPAAPTISSGANELKVYPQGVPPQQTSGAHPYQTSAAPLLSASDFIDRQSLPTWMSSGQPGQPVPPPNQATWQGNPAPAAPPPVNQATWQGNPAPAAPPPTWNVDSGPQSGLSAASLLDVNSLPPWLREGQQAQGQPGSNNMSAGSLIDVNALPSWLRAVDGQPQASQAGRNAPPPLYGTSPRIESARVPGRPRAEMMPLEQSEVAANVFSSMLGVASSTPYYPTPSTGGQQSFSSAPGQPSGSLYAAQPASPMARPSVFNNEQAMPSGVAGAAPQAAQGAMPGSYAGNYTNAYQNSYPNTQNPYTANQGQPMPQQPPVAAMQPGAFNAGQGSLASANAKPGKRSFLDTIREWFHL